MDSLPVPSSRTLTRSLDGALKFLRAVGTNSRIYRALRTEGYSRAHHEEGWRLVLAAMNHLPPPTTPAPQGARRAIQRLDREDGPMLARIKAILSASHPDQTAFLLEGLRAETGVAAVTNIHTILTRIQALRDAPERQPTRQPDHAALATLAAHGLDDERWTELKILVNQAQQLAALEEEEPLPLDEDERTRRLVDVYIWHRKWSALARLAVSNRRYLILLGLATPRLNDQGQEEVVLEPEDDDLADLT